MAADIRATPARVSEAWLDPAIARRWLFATALHPIAHADIEAHAGGCFRFLDRQNGRTIEHAGRFIDIVPNRRLVFVLSMPECPQIVTHVTVELSAVEQGCKLTVTHENVPSECIERMENRWVGMLYGLGETLDEESASLGQVRKEQFA